MNWKEFFKKWWFWLTIVVIILLILSLLPVYGMPGGTHANFWQAITSGPQTGLPTPLPEYLAYICNIDSDCVVKDVHNCCGYFPRCVNKDYIPDIEAVERKCQEEGIMDICGYPEITHCKCIENTCKSMHGDSIV
jgi:hypothetical protein